MAGNLKLKAGAIVNAQITGSSTLASAAAVAAATAIYDNTTNLDRYVSAVLTTGFSVAPAVNAEVQLYLVPALDGVNYADTDTSTPTLTAAHYAGSFWVDKAQTGSQILTLENMKIGPFKYKAFVLNKAGQTMAANWLLDLYGQQAQYT